MRGKFLLSSRFLKVPPDISLVILSYFFPVFSPMFFLCPPFFFELILIGLTLPSEENSKGPLLFSFADCNGFRFFSYLDVRVSRPLFLSPHPPLSSSGSAVTIIEETSRLEQRVDSPHFFPSN